MDDEKYFIVFEYSGLGDDVKTVVFQQRNDAEDK